MITEKCVVCNVEFEDNCRTEVTVTVWTPAGIGGNGVVRTITICNKTACALALFAELRDRAEQKLNKTKTNAVGPLGPGSSGCTFNS
ncbi:MAG: hypothetical protein HY226_03640 [Candidatus Vogelbacteria bacterium]|nr:hypothetical protein [Candidatus Vogelbacteria bacterium]